MPPLDKASRPTGKAYWRSLDELADSSRFRQFVEREFPASADEMLSPASRRGFMKLMGASLALAGMTGCRWPTEEILPFANRPDGYTPGVPRHFATVQELAGSARGIVVTSRDGRPVKIEGNELHPHSLGATDALAQASVLELYDPDRSRHVVRFEGGGETVRRWSDFEGFARERGESLRATSGRGFRVLSESSSSPSLQQMRERVLLALPQAQWHEYEPLSRDNEREGSILAFGKPYRAQHALNEAEVVVALDADVLSQHPAALRHARDWVRGRDPEHAKEFSRLWAVESHFSLTGALPTSAVPSRRGPCPSSPLAWRRSCSSSNDSSFRRQPRPCGPLSSAFALTRSTAHSALSSPAIYWGIASAR